MVSVRTIRMHRALGSGRTGRRYPWRADLVGLITVTEAPCNRSRTLT